MAPRTYRFLSLFAIALAVYSASIAIELAGGIEAAASLIPFRCPLNFLFGISCPTCGLGRSIIATFAGEWRIAMEYHPLGLPVVLISLSIAVSLCFRRAFTIVKLKQLPSLLHRHQEISYAVVACYTVWGFFLRDV